jgi:hypothetical protein
VWVLQTTNTLHLESEVAGRETHFAEIDAIEGFRTPVVEQRAARQTGQAIKNIEKKSLHAESSTNAQDYAIRPGGVCVADRIRCRCEVVHRFDGSMVTVERGSLVAHKWCHKCYHKW